LKKVITVFHLLVSLNCIAQNENTLYLHIDSLIQYELKYEYDTITNQIPKLEWDSTKTLMPSLSTFPLNPSPLIILNGQRVNRIDLNKYKLSDIVTIDIYQKKDIKMRALYGTSSINGVIIIQTKMFQRKSRKTSN